MVKGNCYKLSTETFTKEHLGDLLPVFSRQKNLIGLDIGSHTIKAVQLKQGGGGPSLLAMGICPCGGELLSEGKFHKPERLAGVIKDLVAGLKTRSKMVSVSISGHEVIVKRVEVPMMSEEELKKRMQTELGQYIPYSIEEVDLDYQIINIPPDRPNAMEVLLVAAKKESVAEYLKLIKLCDLEPVVIDVDFFALSNAFEATYGFEEKDLVLIDIGANKAIMSIVSKGFPVFSRGIAIGGRQITEKIEDYLGVSLEEAERIKVGDLTGKIAGDELERLCFSVIMNWVSECRKAINLFHMNYPDSHVQEIYLSGGSCHVPGLARAFEQELGAATKIFNPLNRIVHDQSSFDPAYLEKVGPQMAIALGLAMRKAGEK